MQYKIAAVIVTYNRKKLLEKCIRHILQQSIQGVDALVIDNASTDGTQDMIKTQFGDNKNVKYN